MWSNGWKDKHIRRNMSEEKEGVWPKKLLSKVGRFLQKKLRSWDWKCVMLSTKGIPRVIAGLKVTGIEALKVTRVTFGIHWWPKVMARLQGSLENRSVLLGFGHFQNIWVAGNRRQWGLDFLRSHLFSNTCLFNSSTGHCHYPQMDRGAQGFSIWRWHLTSSDCH